MPAIEYVDTPQIAILWPCSGVDAYGKPQIDVNNPIELSVRWERSNEEILDPDGNTIKLDASVVVDRKIRVGSLMWLGELDDWVGTGSGSGQLDTELMEVVGYKNIPDLKGRTSWEEVGLIRYKNQLPR